jgi:hypothetical protein
MKSRVEMNSDGMIYLPSLMKTATGSQAIKILPQKFEML